MGLYTIPSIDTTGDNKTMKYNTTIGFKVIACIMTVVAIVEFVIGLQIVGVI